MLFERFHARVSSKKKRLNSVKRTHLKFLFVVFFSPLLSSCACVLFIFVCVICENLWQILCLVCIWAGCHRYRRLFSRTHCGFDSSKSVIATVCMCVCALSCVLMRWCLLHISLSHCYRSESDRTSASETERVWTNIQIDISWPMSFSFWFQLVDLSWFNQTAVIKITYKRRLCTANTSVLQLIPTLSHCIWTNLLVNSIYRLYKKQSLI